uniref:Palmitoyltransferase n=1 Tax=Setaria digitata TaxID=48799 RepID=A0A915PS34_9BILA
MRLKTCGAYEWANIGGIVYTLLLIFGIYFLILFYTCPATYQPDQCARANCFGIIIILELLVNFLLFIIYSRRNDPQRWLQGVTILTNVKGAGKYCLECNRIAPLRSHHCRLCNMCVLRKDHHCFVTGACVGIANQRFFIVFVLWASIGGAVGSFFILMYLLQYVESNIYPFGWLKLLAPVAVIRWIISYEIFTNTALCILFSICAATSIVAIIFFGSQMFYTLNGYTMYDYHTLSRKIELHGDGETYSERLTSEFGLLSSEFGMRLRMVFGHYWAVNFIIPLLCFPNQLTADVARNLFSSYSKDM